MELVQKQKQCYVVCHEFIKQNKPLNARETLYKIYPELKDKIEPILDELKLLDDENIIFMKLVQKQKQCYAVCHEEDGESYKESTYVFPSMEEVEKFLGAKDDYKKNVFYKGTDVYGQERNFEYNETPDSINSQIDCLIDWICENG